MRRLLFLPLLLLASAVCQESALAQDATSGPGERPIGSSFSQELLRELPLGFNVYSLLETTQSEVISDRFNSGGLNVGSDARVGGFLGSWTQTRFRIGDVEVSDPAGSGASLLFPDVTAFDGVRVATGLMPIDLNAPGLAVTLEPTRPGSVWQRSFFASGSGGGLIVGAPAGQPVPISRLHDFSHTSVSVSGPLSPRTGLAASGSFATGSSATRERLANTSDRLVNGNLHLVSTSANGVEWRTYLQAQGADSPHAHWTLAPTFDASTHDTAVHVQSTVANLSGVFSRFFAGYTQRRRSNDGSSNGLAIERIVDGPVTNLVDSFADTRSSRLAVGARGERGAASSTSASSRHRLTYGVDADLARSVVSNFFSGTVRESVNAIPARVWSMSSPATESTRTVTAANAFASDSLVLSDRVSMDVGLRLEYVTGKADGAAERVHWLSALPHAYLRWRLSDRRSFVFGYARSANALQTQWLAFGDPNAPVATVAAAAFPNVTVARFGPGTGGSPSFSAVDSSLKRPVTDEFVIGFEKRRSPTTRYTLTGIARREVNMLGVVNSVGTSGYTTVSFPDAGKDLVDPSDDRELIVYNRLPSSYARDSYLLTNPEQDAATAFALRMAWERETEKLFLLFGATASAAQGSGGNRGYGPLENDQDVPGEAFITPNAQSYARGRLFSDRAFTIKWTTRYRLPKDLTVAAIARYQDGQPFSRLVVVPTLNQGAEAVQAYPNAGSRFTFTGTLDLRVEKAFPVGRSRLSAVLDAYNLFTRSNEVEEYVVSGTGFRTSTAIQPPATVHLGVRVSF